MSRVSNISLCLIALVLAAGCTETEPPSRDQIPLLRSRVSDLDKALHSRSRAGLDSLMSVDMLDYGQDSDSLLGFVYGPGRDLAFKDLGNYQISYTSDFAVIECEITYGDHTPSRPVRFVFKKNEDVWLLRKFEDLPEKEPRAAT